MEDILARAKAKKREAADKLVAENAAAEVAIKSEREQKKLDAETKRSERERKKAEVQAQQEKRIQEAERLALEIKEELEKTEVTFNELRDLLEGGEIDEETQSLLTEGRAELQALTKKYETAQNLVLELRTKLQSQESPMFDETEVKEFLERCRTKKDDFLTDEQWHKKENKNKNTETYAEYEVYALQEKNKIIRELSELASNTKEMTALASESNELVKKMDEAYSDYITTTGQLQETIEKSGLEKEESTTIDHFDDESIEALKKQIFELFFKGKNLLSLAEETYQKFHIINGAKNVNNLSGPNRFSFYNGNFYVRGNTVPEAVEYRYSDVKQALYLGTRLAEDGMKALQKYEKM